MSSSEKPSVDNESSAGGDQSERARVTRRRALLGAISVAGAAGATHLPQQWARPVVDHVILPAHAQLSPAGTQTVTCDLTCSVGTLYEIELAGTCGTSLYLFDVSQFLFTDCVSEPGGDVSRSSVISGSFVSCGTDTDTGSLAASGVSGPFTQTGICEELV